METSPVDVQYCYVTAFGEHKGPHLSADCPLHKQNETNSTATTDDAISDVLGEHQTTTDTRVYDIGLERYNGTEMTLVKTEPTDNCAKEDDEVCIPVKQEQRDTDMGGGVSIAEGVSAAVESLVGLWTGEEDIRTIEPEKDDILVEPQCIEEVGNVMGDPLITGGKANECINNSRPSPSKSKGRNNNGGENPLHRCEACGKCYNKPSGLRTHSLYCNEEKADKLRKKCHVCCKRFNTSCKLGQHCVMHFMDKKKKSFKCPRCEKLFENGDSLRNHILTHFDNTPFKCRTCGKCFNNTKDFDIHRERHDCEMTSYGCNHCNEHFEHEKHLINHVITHVLLSNLWKCNFCGTCFAHPKSLASHTRWYKCEQCHQCFEYKKTHLKEKHMPHTCNCGKVFQGCKTFNKHILVNPSHDKPFQCEQCNEHFESAEKLKKHVYIIHLERVYKCKLCHWSFRKPDELEKHLKVHSDDRPYACDQCGHCFTNQKRLDKHQTWHTLKKTIECSYCDKRFVYPHKLKRHLIIHFEDKPFECKACGKGFKDKNSLRRHSHIHSGEKPYECNQCSKCFRRLDNFNAHLIKHTADRPFKCKYCDKYFNSRSVRCVHEKKVHIIPSIPKSAESFKCEVCETSYTSSGYFNRHLLSKKHKKRVEIQRNRIHETCDPPKDTSDINRDMVDNRRSFMCEVCEKSYTNSYHLKRHLLTRIHKNRVTDIDMVDNREGRNIHQDAEDDLMSESDDDAEDDLMSESDDDAEDDLMSESDDDAEDDLMSESDDDAEDDLMSESDDDSPAYRCYTIEEGKGLGIKLVREEPDEEEENRSSAKPGNKRTASRVDTAKPGNKRTASRVDTADQITKHRRRRVQADILYAPPKHYRLDPTLDRLGDMKTQRRPRTRSTRHKQSKGHLSTVKQRALSESAKNCYSDEKDAKEHSVKSTDNAESSVANEMDPSQDSVTTPLCVVNPQTSDIGLRRLDPNSVDLTRLGDVHVLYCDLKQGVDGPVINVSKLNTISVELDSAHM